MTDEQNWAYTTALPERTILAFQPLGARIAAGAIDTLLIILLDFAIFVMSGTAIEPDGPLPKIVVFGLPVVAFVYYVLSEGIASTTVGKRLFGMCVRRTDGRSPGMAASLKRNIARPVDMVPFVVPYLLGALMIANSRRRQRLGDLFADTVVVSLSALELNVERTAGPPAALLKAQGGDPNDQPGPAQPA